MKYLLMSLWLVFWYYTYCTSMLVWPCMFKVMCVHVGVARWGGVFKYVGVVISLTPYPS